VFVKGVAIKRLFLRQLFRHKGIKKSRVLGVIDGCIFLLRPVDLARIRSTYL
jgi:hypothetical protein